MILIRNWYGRLGNNIQQVSNAIYLGLKQNENVSMPYHPFFLIQVIRITNEDIDRQQQISDDDFFSKKHVRSIQSNQTLTNQILKKISKINSPKQSLGEKDLVIHIRSGDIFSSNPHPGFVQPPVSYYCHILDTYEFETVYIISQDTKNPVIQILLNRYPNIIYKNEGIEKDIQLLLSSQNVVVSKSSFTQSLLQISDHIKTVYKPSYVDDVRHPGIRHISVNLDDYKKTMGDWKNTGEQIRIMTEYKLNTTLNDK